MWSPSAFVQNAAARVLLYAKKKNDHIYLTDSLVKYTPKQNTPLHQQGIIARTSRIISSAIMESALFQSIIGASLWNNLQKPNKN